MSRFPQPPAWQSEAERLIVRLRRRKSQWAGEPSLHNLTPRTIDKLLEIVDRAAEVHTHNTWGIGVTLSLMLVFCWRSRPEYMALPVTIGLALLCAIWLSSGARPRYAVYALTRANDVRVLPTLIWARRFPWGKRREVRHAIEHLLMQVTEDHAGVLSLADQKALWNVAIPSFLGNDAFYEVLALRTLQAIAKIGNAEMLTRMRRLAGTPVVWLRHQPVKWAAQDLVPVMEERLQRQEVPETLLRASAAANATPDTLLRAAYPTTTEPETQLLRASTSEPSADER